MPINMDILQHLEHASESLTRSQKKVANYIICNPVKAAFATIEEIADTIGVSTTTVVRLAISLGYSGFADFQKALEEIVQTRSQPFIRFEANYENRNSDEGEQLLSDIINLNMQNIEETIRNLNRDKLFKAIDSIENAKRVFVYGTRSGAGIANYLEHNINRILQNVNPLSDLNGRLPDNIMKISQGDTLIAIAMPRYVEEVILVTKIAKERGATVIGFTDGYWSPLIETADISFLVPCKSNDFHNAMTSTMFLSEVLISILAYKNSNKVKNNLFEVENIMKQLNRKTFVN